MGKNATINTIKTLLSHKDFAWTNPNKVYAVLASFTNNLPLFHAKDCTGYDLLISCILKLDAINPNVASRLSRSFSQIKWLTAVQKQNLSVRINRLLTNKLSKNTKEIITNIANEQNNRRK